MGTRADLAFCPGCRRAAPRGAICPDCRRPCDAPAETYPERLLETVLSQDTTRAGMAVDVLTKRLHEPRAIVPLIMMSHSQGDPYLLVLSPRGMGWLGDPQTVPVLVELLLDEEKPFVARIAAAEALGSIRGGEALQTLNRAQRGPRPSVAKTATKAMTQFQCDGRHYERRSFSAVLDLVSGCLSRIACSSLMRSRPLASW